MLGLVHQFVVTVERFWSCDQACLRAKDPISLVPGGGPTMWVTVKRPSDTRLRNYEGFNMSCMIGRADRVETSLESVQSSELHVWSVRAKCNVGLARDAGVQSF